MSTEPVTTTDVVRRHAAQWPIVAAILAFAIQWGVVSSRLGALEKRLDEFLIEARTMRAEYTQIDRRLATLEGQLSHQRKQATPTGPGNDN